MTRSRKSATRNDDVRLLVLALDTMGDRIGRETLRLAGSLPGWSVLVVADVTETRTYVVGHAGHNEDTLERDAFLALLRREWLPQARAHLAAIDTPLSLSNVEDHR